MFKKPGLTKVVGVSQSDYGQFNCLDVAERADVSQSDNGQKLSDPFDSDVTKGAGDSQSEKFSILFDSDIAKGAGDSQSEKFSVPFDSDIAKGVGDFQSEKFSVLFDSDIAKGAGDSQSEKFSVPFDLDVAKRAGDLQSEKFSVPFDLDVAKGAGDLQSENFSVPIDLDVAKGGNTEYTQENISQSVKTIEHEGLHSSFGIISESDVVVSNSQSLHSDVAQGGNTIYTDDHITQNAKRNEQEALHTKSESSLVVSSSQMFSATTARGTDTHVSVTEGATRKQQEVSQDFKDVGKSKTNRLLVSDNQDFSETPPSDIAKEGGVATTKYIPTHVSRSIRNKRKLEKAGADCSQTQITDYLKVVNDVEACIEGLLLENKKLSSMLQQYANTEQGALKSFTPILKELIRNAQNNAGKNSTQRRHPAILKQFATALFIYSGPLAYKFIYHNTSGALPSLRTIQRVVHSEYKTINEGSFRFDDLLKYIEKHNAPHYILIGEDATRLISRIDYDGETDRCVGFVLPDDSKTGLPTVDAYKAVSFEAIQSMFSNATIAKYAYVYMVQALCHQTPPFCLACFGTDNKFDAKQIVLRWNYIYTECKKRGITVLSFGADGDSRLMKAMKEIAFQPKTDFQISPKCILTPPSIPKTWLEWFKVVPSSISLVQDVVHLAVKMKSRLLKPSIILPMGPYVATSSHLRMMQLSFGKDMHGLREKDVNHKDKQNFNAVMHIVRSAHLLEQFPEAKATRHYIKITVCAVDSYLDKSLDPIARIEKAWYALFFLRLWRQWIILNRCYTLKDNFITSNAFMCMEINAHSLITHILTIRDHAPCDQYIFLPWLLGSQVYEATFRTIRSMNSTFSTVINFGMLGLLRRLHRLQIQSILQADTASVITFPRVVKHQVKEEKNCYIKSTSNIKNQDILDAVRRAEQKAKAVADDLGMAELLKKHKKWDSATRTSCNDSSNHNCDDNYEDDDDIDCEELLNEKDDGHLIHELYTDEEQQISQDIKIITENRLAESNVIEKLNKFKTKFRRITLDTIPLYKEQELPPRKQNFSLYRNFFT